MNNLFNIIYNNPIIASVTRLEQLDTAINSPCKIIFLLTGNIFNLKEISNRIFKEDKYLFIYIDAIDGFSKDSWGLEYIVKNIPLTGIITSKSDLVQQGKSMGIFTIHRMFVHDILSLNKLFDSISKCPPHAIEVLPGIMPKIIKIIVKDSLIPLIAGGLILEEEDIITSLEAGAIAISTGNQNIWYNNY